MWYFVVSFQATINGDLTEQGTAGVVSHKMDYRSNAIKTEAIEFYKRKYNTDKPVVVSILGTVLPSAAELYDMLRSTFTIEIIQKGFGPTY